MKIYKLIMGILIIISIFLLVEYAELIIASDVENIKKWNDAAGFWGDLSGPIISILAFLGLLYSLSLTKNQYLEQSNENTFFLLLEFHSSKVHQLRVDNNEGYEVFKFLSEKFNDYYKEFIFSYVGSNFISILNSQVVLEHILQDSEFDFLINDAIEYWPNKPDNPTSSDYLSYFNESEFAQHRLSQAIHDGLSESKKIKVYSLCDVYFNSRPTKDIQNDLSDIYSSFYHDYGHVIGHYFRSMYYVLEHVDKMENSNKYAKIFRSQLSRYEIVMLMYNMTSDYGSKKFNLLINKYELFNGIYEKDICYHPKEFDYKAFTNEVLKY
ncbi:hypothetical protein J4H55_23850 [Vibrio alginolyticus]|uniref:putative phage abortive infection protein n=1 Tax=Vibrio alginolyticus TaxID=663 RepID=UPI001BD3EE8E|nr:hypothetical protein [Vibrio alginolyticus]